MTIDLSEINRWHNVFHACTVCNPITTVQPSSTIYALVIGSRRRKSHSITWASFTTLMVSKHSSLTKWINNRYSNVLSSLKYTLVHVRMDATHACPSTLKFARDITSVMFSWCYEISWALCFHDAIRLNFNLLMGGHGATLSWTQLCIYVVNDYFSYDIVCQEARLQRPALSLGL